MYPNMVTLDCSPCSRAIFFGHTRKIMVDQKVGFWWIQHQRHFSLQILWDIFGILWNLFHMQQFFGTLRGGSWYQILCFSGWWIQIKGFRTPKWDLLFDLQKLLCAQNRLHKHLCSLPWLHAQINVKHHVWNDLFY